MTTFVPQLGIYLDDTLLNLWNTSEKHRARWMESPPPDFGPSDGPGTVVVVVHVPNERDGRRCLHLANRTEHVAGCNGWRCAHDCELGLPAVPGEYCQTCDEFEDDGAW